MFFTEWTQELDRFDAHACIDTIDMDRFSPPRRFAMQFRLPETCKVLITVLTSCFIASQCPAAAAQTSTVRSSDNVPDHGSVAVEQRVDPICAASAATISSLENVKEAAAQGDPAAQHNLGVIYWCGIGLKSDFAEAAAWYRKAAEQGYENSQFNLAEMYLHGYGVQRDAVTAAYWLRKAADQGQANAQSELGNLYALGIGVHEDDTLAATLFRKAAIQGDESAQTKLGLMLKNGQSVQQNPIAAYAWLKIAETTHPGSVVGLLSYRPILSGDSLSIAEEIARNWKVGTMVPEDMRPTRP
ncbi:tetratricopeptide repeat protein [Paraburkholderia bannensis]|uniref:tetratricopeptide repeat protein n=1 Tax=Paraburkholderia bannensis TaxID=765414 RepID=UPI002ABD898A|nr:tetratricopeptide repeat protein [Paraburkholderia bannensis]